MPAVALVDQAIEQACHDGASDIHFEVDRRGLAVRFRIDGVMTAISHCDDARTAEEAISRIKVLAQLDITERRRPQDGRMHWATPAADHPGLRTEDRVRMDLRVSIMPSIHGEDAVLRLLDRRQLRGAGSGDGTDAGGASSASSGIDLDRLGFDAPTAAQVRSLAARPHGMLLATGPTGSGKTTTIYAALCEANTGLEKIVTIEDPVEYELPGVLQIPVNEAKGLTFASGLRSILRHDPDRILVGEIRDAETAQIAVQSALTGHLVYTTVHANSLLDVLGRMRHLGIDPFALAASLNGVIVQRLLRRVCAHCARWRTASPAQVAWLVRHAGEASDAANAVARADVEASSIASPTDDVRVPIAHGCTHCRHSGYRGRLVVAAVHAMDETLRDLIAAQAAPAHVRAALEAATQGQTLAARAGRLALTGATTLEEITRVLGPT